MSKMRDAQTPTDEKILSYTNVPVNMAAAYLGVSPQTVRSSLIQKTAPYGYAVQNPEAGIWTFQISPGALVNYQNGVLNGLNVSGAVELMTAEVEKLLETRMKAAMEILCPGMMALSKNERRAQT